MDDASSPETFKAFKDSFLYGTRTDLNFKFLSHLDDSEAGRFFSELLKAVSAAADDGDAGRLAELIVAWQTHGYHEQKNFGYETGPFTALEKPPSRPLRHGCG